jgi:hypothetical protein
VPAVIPVLDASLSGGMNIHLPVEFDDGVKWLVRIRQKRFHAPPSTMRTIITASEVTTIQVMHEAGLKVLGVHVSSLGRGGVELDGKPLSEFPFFLSYIAAYTYRH